MTNKVSLPKPILIELIDQTIIPFKRHLLDDEALSRIATNKEIYKKLAWLITKLEEALFVDLENGLTQLQTLCDFVRSLEVPTHRFRQKVNCLLYEELPKWLSQSVYLTQAQKEVLHDNLVKLQEAFTEMQKKHLCGHEEFEVETLPPKPSEEDEFFSFESEEVDEAINDMHTSDAHREVISAVEFMDRTDMDYEFIENISDYLEELEVTLHKETQLNPETLQALASRFETLALGLNSSIEFIDLGYGLQKLSQLLTQIPIETLPIEQTQLLKSLLEEFISDLFQWTEHIFVDQDAQDIHYLDAALLASIEQLKVLFSNAEPPSSHTSSEKGELTDDNDDSFIAF